MTEWYKLGLQTWPIYKGQKAIPIKHGNKYGFFVPFTCKFIKPKYKYISPFQGGRSRVCWTDDKYGYVDLHGNETWDENN